MDMFGNLWKDTRRRLRDTIREKEVYVERCRGVLTWKALLAAAQEELTWPADETGTEDGSVQIESHPAGGTSKANETVLTSNKGKSYHVNAESKKLDSNTR